MKVSQEKFMVWALVFALCVIAYVAGNGTSPAYAGCGSWQECRDCAEDRCGVGEYRSWSYSGGECNTCCTRSCEDVEPCEC